MAIIRSTGLFTPPHHVSNEALVAAFNLYVDSNNATHTEAIARGEREALQHSSVAFIEKASGIQGRYLMAPEGVLDPAVMAPRMPERGNEELSVLAEMGLAAARQALTSADVAAEQLDVIIVACSNLQRAYPAIAIEIQQALGAGGYAFDMNVACSSATFGIKTAADAINAGTARRILVISPEICSGHLNFCDRDSHFIFGDAATAVLVEADNVSAGEGFDIVSARCVTRFSNNIRNNFGFLNRTCPETREAADKLFVQHGRSVFKEVCPLVARLISEHLAAHQILPNDIKRLWLHQANLSMNQLIAKQVLGRDFAAEDAPVILDEYANTSSAGSIIAFHKHRADFQASDMGVICSFGAGYSVGSLLLRKR